MIEAAGTRLRKWHVHTMNYNLGFLPIGVYLFISHGQTLTGKEFEILQAHKTALSKWRLVDGDNADSIDWNDHRLPTVRLSKSLFHICRYDKSFKFDARGFSSREDIFNGRQHIITPMQMLVLTGRFNTSQEQSTKIESRRAF